MKKSRKMQTYTKEIHQEQQHFQLLITTTGLVHTSYQDNFPKSNIQNNQTAKIYKPRITTLYYGFNKQSNVYK